MYIRRKVFSLLQDEYGEERYFSTTEFVNDYYDERMYAEAEDEDEDEDEDEEIESKHIGRKIAAGTGIAAGGAVGTAGAYQGVRHAVKGAKVKKAEKALKAEIEELSNLATNGNTEATRAKAVKRLNELKDSVDSAKNKTNAVDRFGKNKIQGGVRKGYEAVKDSAGRVRDFTKNSWNGADPKTMKKVQKVYEPLKNQANMLPEEIEAVYKAGEEAFKKASKPAKIRNRALMIGVPVVAAGSATAGVIAHKKHKKNNEE